MCNQATAGCRGLVLRQSSIGGWAAWRPTVGEEGGVMRPSPHGSSIVTAGATHVPARWVDVAPAADAVTHRPAIRSKGIGSAGTEA